MCVATSMYAYLKAGAREDQNGVRSPLGLYLQGFVYTQPRNTTGILCKRYILS